jgi:hypothetical protein
MRLLRHQDENPFATVMAVTRDGVRHGIEAMEKDLAEEDKLVYRPAGTELDSLAPCVSEDDKDSEEKSLRRMIGLVLWRNWDKFFDR